MPADGTLPQAVESFPVGKTGDRFLDAELARERVRISLAKADQPSGVRWSGMDAEPFRARTIGQMIADADKARKAAESPRGRFLQALQGVADYPTWEAAAEKARAAYWRGFADDGRATSVGEIGVALLALNDAPGQAARDAREALAEILIQTSRKAA